MKAKPADDSERMILMSMIRSTDFLKRIRPAWKAEFFVSAAARLLSSWCVKYFDEYRTAPASEVQTFPHTEDYQRLSEEDQAWLSKILITVRPSAEESNFNLEYHLDLASRYFQKRNLVLLSEKVRSLAEDGEVIQAEGIVREWKPVANGRERGSYLFQEPSQIIKAFSDRDQSFRLFAGGLGRELNPHIGRDSFFAFMAPEKRGKSMWLMEVAVRASRKRLNVAMFQLGDMSENQVLRRFAIRIAGKSDDPRFCGELWKPVSDCVFNQDGSCEEGPCAEEDREPLWTDPPNVLRLGNDFVPEMIFDKWTPDWEVCRNRLCARRKLALWYEKTEPVNPLTAKEAYRVAKDWKKRNGPIRISYHSAGTCSVANVSSILDLWEAEDGFAPDVIIFDYPDIMAPEPYSVRKERRHQENDRWIALRALSTERRAAVVVATQTSASAYGRRKISLSDYSEDKRKFAHVTAMYAINQTPIEKRLKVLRISPLLVRDGEGDQSLEIPVLYFPEIYQACLASG